MTAKQNSTVHWFDIQPSDLKGKNFEELTEQYRSDRVAVLVTHLESLDGTVFILLSPIGFAFTWSLPCYSTRSLHWHGTHDFNWGKNPERKRAYARELRRAGIRKIDPQASLFGNFDRECGRQSGGVPSLSANPRYLEFYRLESYGFERAYEPAVRRYIERMFEQLGQWAFEPFPEGVPIETLPSGHSCFDSLLMTWRDLTSDMFNVKCDEVKSDALAEKVLTELKRSVDRLQRGLAFDVPEEPINRIRRPIFFTCPTGYERPLTVEVLSYRSRLVRLLGCPGYFDAVERQLPELRETWPALSADKTFPYNPIEELEAYLAEMLERYPVLGEDPFASADLPADHAAPPAPAAVSAPSDQEPPVAALDDKLLAKLSTHAIGLKPSSSDITPPLGASHFGGLPDLPAALDWPHGNLAPLSFLAQINCREAAPFDTQKRLPSQGILYFFYDVIEQPWGGSAAENADAIVLYTPDESGLTRTSPPDGLNEEEGILPTVGMTFETILSLDDHPKEALLAAGLNDAQIDAYYERYDERNSAETDNDTPKHRLLGKPDQIQNDMPPECAALKGGGAPEEWRLLFQLDSDELLDTMWGDMGRLYFWIRAEALKQAHFADTCAFLQCH
ncbi:MAG: YwqG family protein [Sulfuricellaceae bacterium]